MHCKPGPLTPPGPASGGWIEELLCSWIRMHSFRPCKVQSYKMPHRIDVDSDRQASQQGGAPGRLSLVVRQRAAPASGAAAMSLTDEQNDACWAVKMGKAPNDDQARAIMSAAQKVGGDDGMAANALVRMLGGYGADEPLVEMLKAICEQKDVGAELVSMLDQYADESNGKPDSFDISQLSNILNMLLGDVQDRHSRRQESRQLVPVLRPEAR